MASLDKLTVIANKISADVDTRLAADAQALADKDTTIAARDATIVDLNAQLAAFQNDAATIDAVTAVLSAADDKLVPPAPAPEIPAA